VAPCSQLSEFGLIVGSNVSDKSWKKRIINAALSKEDRFFTLLGALEFLRINI